MSLKVVDPSSGEVIDEVPEISSDKATELIEKAEEQYRQWRETTFSERAELLRQAAADLQENAETYAELMAREMGKPLQQGISEAEKCAWVCDYYAENAEHFLEREVIETDASKSFVTFQPIGVVLAVMPWNFPFWQVFRFAAPSLMAGNVGLLKHASNVPGCAQAIETLFRKAGFPEHVFTTLLIASDKIEEIIEHPSVKAVTLTGSTPAGKAVAKKAGEMLKKTVLELGGSDPYVILQDADIEAAVSTCVSSRLINGGQSCIAAKRFIVVEAIREKFESMFVQEMRSKKMGDPMQEGTDIGPQARHDLRDELHNQTRESIDKGARCLLGGDLPDGDGAFYPPTVLTDVKPGMPAYEQELFGPVAAIIPVKGEAEAIETANDSPFGLGAAVFTQDVEKGEYIATEKLQAGCCFVNDFVKSDPRLPFGGIKESGYGRELSHYGIKEFVNIKTVSIK